MLKQKTFIFNVYDLGKWNSAKSQADFDEGVINRKIDGFLKDKELVSVNMTSFTRGNNPPNGALVYTVVYKEEK